MMVTQAPHQITLESPTLKHGQPIPQQHTADGANTSPELRWSNLPSNASQLVVICEDRDTFVPNRVPFLQWVVYCIPATATTLPAAMPAVEVITAPDDLIGAFQAYTAFDTPGYRGPQPPVGTVHRYRFVVFALDSDLGLQRGLSANAVFDAITGHVTGAGEIAGTYERKARS